MNGNDRNLLVIKASAGSGKTYNLALQYIRLLLFTTDGNGRMVPRRKPGMSGVFNAHRQLLAITFTNKATDEMKERIVNELYSLSQDSKDSDYLATFMDETGLDETSVRTLARQALHELLFDYSNFNVSTIDSFFQVILRNFARELDRDFNYDIQLEEVYAVRVALHNFLLSLGQEGKPTQVDDWVKAYLRHMTHGDANKRRWKFFDDGGDLLDFAKQINTELFRTHMQEIRDYLGHVDENGEFQSDFQRIRDFKKYMHQVVENLEAQLERVAEELMRELNPVSDGLKGNSALFYAMKAGGIKTDSLNGADEEKIASQFKKTASVEPERVARITRLVSRHFALQPLLPFFKTVENGLGMLGMLAMIDLFLERFRHETNSILIGDTNDLIGTVLESGSDFVYERVGTMISHFMIDEFQDTSTKQYENFRGLLRESLANGNFNMLIGDAKQSIYRFRNADPAVFRDKVSEDFVDDINQPQVEQGQPQSTNFRSSPNIIKFNNLLYEYVSTCYPQMPAVAKTYQDVRQGMPNDINDKKVPGYVRVLTGNYRKLLDDEFISDVFRQEGFAVDGEQALDALDVLPAYLMQLHQRFDWGRMGILVNSNKQGNQVVERILEFNRTAPEPISIISGDSLLLSNSSVVRRIIALLRFIDINQFASQEDEDNIDEEGQPDKTAQRMTAKRLSDQRLYAGLSRFIQAVTAHPDASPQENGNLLDDSLAVDDGTGGNSATAQLLEQLLPSGNELTTLVSIVESIIAYFKRDQVTNADVDREAAFLLAFQDTVLQFTSMRNGGSVREFLKFWDETKDKLTVNASATTDAINILTIHKAKGLEFDCVVIPFANWELNGNSLEHSYWMPGNNFAEVLKALVPDVGECDAELLPPLLNVPKKMLVDAFEAGTLTGGARDFVEEQLTAVVLDNLNKTYVAMTRPRTELHMFTEAGKYNDLSPLLEAFIEAHDVVTPIIGADGEPTGWYEYGEISSREEIDAKRKEEPVTALQVTMSQYPVNDIPLQVKVLLEHASSASIDAGIRLHSVMSRIHDRNDVDRAIDQAVKHGTITQDPADPCSLDNINTHVRRPIMTDGTRVAAWFDPQNIIYSERTVTTAVPPTSRNEEGIENLRPDRIIRRPDGQILVIDYKSGKRDDKEYLRKLNLYIDRLRRIFPDTPIAGRLWYTNLDLILDEKGQQLPF